MTSPYVTLKLAAPCLPHDRSIPDKARELDRIDEYNPGTLAVFRDVLLGRRPWPLLLIGGAGTGKTSAALCLADRLGGKWRCPYWPLVDLCAELVRAMNGQLWNASGYRVSETQLWRMWSRAPLTILDEVGARIKISDHHYETLKRALDLRENKPAICIANLELRDIERIYDDRIASRIGGGTTVVMCGVDRRLATGGTGEGKPR